MARQAPQTHAGLRDGIRLSIVLTNYNDARWLPCALDALLAEISPADELIIVDDASTDDSIEVVARYQHRFPHFRLHRHPCNKGTAAGLMSGLQHARGRFVFFTAADDYILPGLFDASIAMLDRHPAAALSCAELRMEDAGGNKRGYRPFLIPSWKPRFFSAQEAKRMLCRIDSCIYTHTVVFRADALRRNGGFPVELASFSDGFMVRYLAMEEGFCFMPRVLAVCRLDPKSYSATRMTSPDESLRILEAVRARFAQAPRHVVPATYLRLIERRWLFSSARLILYWRRRDFDPAVIGKVLGNRGADRLVLTLVSRFPVLSRPAALAWVAMRLRPFHPFPVLTSSVRCALRKLHLISA